ncbi:hypothetical protein SLEP1_g32607 [Rubroshorea leprosula]|uniref:Uncharacterized protein n=1 Tax=Rubroshorea leprosula TaxID=152421 RepID=A0AAV5KDV3_9ROSI|nr:hypothetical protein SLEP1_g32607 [Rubroshorea leprosula]
MLSGACRFTPEESLSWPFSLTAPSLVSLLLPMPAGNALVLSS